jgi:hypothetical protein
MINPNMEPKNQTFMQFYPGDGGNLMKNAGQAQLTMNRNTKINNKYESMR